MSRMDRWGDFIFGGNFAVTVVQFCVSIKHGDWFLTILAGAGAAIMFYLFRLGVNHEVRVAEAAKRLSEKLARRQALRPFGFGQPPEGP